MASEYRRPYLDSNVFIAFVKKEENIGGVNRYLVARHILTRAAHGHFQIYTSALTLAEVHKLRGQSPLAPDQDDRLLRFFENDYIRLVDVDRIIGEEANRFCRRFGITPNDAIHLACALRAGCDVLLCWDKRFAKVTTVGIRLEEPEIIGQVELPDMPSSLPNF
jgi:predicted nucleic acid-binding protein